MRNVLKRMKNQFSDLFDFKFLRYGRSCNNFSTIFEYKIDHISKLKIEIQILLIFIFRVLVIFVLENINFRDNSKNKNRKIDFSFVSAHYASSIKIGSKLRGGGCAYHYLGQGLQ